MILSWYSKKKKIFSSTCLNIKLQQYITYLLSLSCKEGSSVLQLGRGIEEEGGWWQREEEEDNHKERKQRDEREESSEEEKQSTGMMEHVYLLQNLFSHLSWYGLHGKDHMQNIFTPIPSTQPKYSPLSPSSPQLGVVSPPSGYITNTH